MVTNSLVQLNVSDDAVWWSTNRPKINPVLHVILLQLGQDVFPVRVFAESGNVRSDLGDEGRGI